MHNCISLSHSSCGTQWSYYLQIQVDKQGHSHLVMPESYFLKSLIRFLCWNYLRCFLIRTLVCQSTVKPVVPECGFVISGFYLFLRVSLPQSGPGFWTSKHQNLCHKKLEAGPDFRHQTLCFRDFPHLTQWFTCICSGMFPRVGSGVTIKMFFPSLAQGARRLNANCKAPAQAAAATRQVPVPQPCVELCTDPKHPSAFSRLCCGLDWGDATSSIQK